MKESTKEEMAGLAWEKSRVSSNTDLWRDIASALRDELPLTDEFLDALEHESLKKIAYLRELLSAPNKNASALTIRLALLERAYCDLFQKQIPD